MDFEGLVRSPQLRTLLQQLDAVGLDAAGIRKKLETARLTPADLKTWLAALREQLAQIEALVATLGEKPR